VLCILAEVLINEHRIVTFQDLFVPSVTTGPTCLTHILTRS